MVKLTSWGRPKDVTLQVSLWDEDVSPKLEEYVITNFLVSNTHIWWIKTENITTEMHFLLMSKIDVLGTSRERRPPDASLGPL